MTPLEQAESVRERFRAKREDRWNGENGAPGAWELNAACYNAAQLGSPVKHFFLLECMRLQWAGDEAVLKLDHGEFKNYWAYRIAYAFCNFKRLTFMGCGSSGKTHVVGLCIYTAWKCAAWKTSALISTTSGESADQRIWGSMKDFYRADKLRIGKLLEYKHSIVLTEERAAKDRDYKNSIHLVLIKPGSEGDNALAAISGRKNDIVIWVRDEGQLMSNDITGARSNLMTNPFYQDIQLGNAPREGTQFYEDAKPYGPKYPNGYRSVDLNTEICWPTKTGMCFWLDGEKSPNLTEDGSDRFPRIMNSESIKDIESEWGGRDTPGYWTQVRGFPHTSDIQDTVLTPALITAFGADKDVIWRGERVTVLAGFDSGLKSDGDPCVIDFLKLGHEIDGTLVAEFEKETIIVASSSESKDPYEIQIARKVIALCQERDCKSICHDVSGDGGIMLKALMEAAAGTGIEITPVSFGGSPDDTMIGNGDDRKCSEVYDRRVTQLWYNVRFAVQAGVIRGMQPYSRATQQLCQRKVVIQNKEKRISVETKRDMKKRIKRSPDDADSRVLAIENARRHGLSMSVSIIESEEPEEDFDEPEEKQSRYQSGFHSKSRYNLARH